MHIAPVVILEIDFFTAHLQLTCTFVFFDILTYILTSPEKENFHMYLPNAVMLKQTTPIFIKFNADYKRLTVMLSFDIIDM